VSTPIRAAIAALALVIVPLTATACAASAPPAVEETAAPTTAPEKEDAGSEPAAGFTRVADDSGAISVEVPSSWAQVDGAGITETTYQLSAAPDLGAFAAAVHAAYDAPGLTIIATQDDTISDDEYIQRYVEEFGPDCSDGETDAYDDGVYRGKYLYLPGCGTAGADVVIVVAHDYEDTGTVLVSMTLVSEEDKQASRDHILSTFYVTFPQ
jgi:serine protease Do